MLNKIKNQRSIENQFRQVEPENLGYRGIIVENLDGSRSDFLNISESHLTECLQVSKMQTQTVSNLNLVFWMLCRNSKAPVTKRIQKAVGSRNGESQGK